MMRSNINISPSSCDPSPSRFSSLPEEIYLAIVSSLDAVSVVSLSKKNPFSPFRFASGMETCGRDSGVSRGCSTLFSVA
ncbi:hypothetical protein DL93DRAFT_2087868 [Clavulina sp. PMI_390]|nr:hypothetical protein DL93DRAFT_2087868 [Clavulina sp. PMI_390]